VQIALIWGFSVQLSLWRYKLNEVCDRINAEVRQQKKLDIIEEKDFRREELLGKFMAKMLYRWNDEEFEEKYLRKLERN